MRAQAENNIPLQNELHRFLVLQNDRRWRRFVRQNGPYKTLIPLNSTAHFAFYCILLLKHKQTPIHFLHDARWLIL